MVTARHTAGYRTEHANGANNYQHTYTSYGRTEAYAGQYVNSSHAQMYVYGSAVENQQVLPQRMPESRPVREKQTSRQVRKNRNRALSINPAYAGFLAVAAVVAVLVCVCYLKLQSDTVNRLENIASLQDELNALTEENDTALQAAEDAINLEEVRAKAVGELGMVYASQGNVIEYDAPANDSVTQYSDIPSNGILAKSGDADD